ncbi:MAG: hypothetical protein M1821_009830 [Bathelium mastoideum]|nr:MAG: hypothetical protein M1821_009830 [Bathelium mastoideum]
MTTPSHQSHDEINEIAETLALKYNIPLKRRNGLYSPERSRGTDSDDCYNTIRFLFYRDRKALNNVIDTFERCALAYSTPDSQLRCLKDLLLDERWQCIEQIQPSSLINRLQSTGVPVNPEPPPVRHEASDFSSNPFFRDGDEEHLTSNGRPRSVGSLVVGNNHAYENTRPLSNGQHFNQPLAQVPQAIKEELAFSPKSPVKIELSPRSGNYWEPRSPSDGDHSYETAPETPPDSPTLAAQSERQKRLVFKQVAETHDNKRGQTANEQQPIKPARKRSSEEMIAGKQVAETQSVKRTKSNEELPQERGVDQSFTSQDSKVTSLNNSFWSQNTDSQTTANTSFVSESDSTIEPKQLQDAPKFFHTSGTVSVDDAEMRSCTEAVERGLESSLDLSANTAATESANDDPLSQRMESLQLDDPVQDVPLPKPDSAQSTSEHYLVRDLPTQGLFCEDLPANLVSVDIFTRYEACRVALESGIPVSELLSGYHREPDEYDSIWSHFRALAHGGRMPKPTNPKTWQAARAGSSDVVLTGSLSFNTVSKDKLFRLRLEPIKSEKSCRFQRKFGSDRFLYVSVPSIQEPPKGLGFLKGQETALASRYRQWLGSDHKFLGRTWRVLMVETKQSKKTSRQPIAISNQRLILFATSEMTTSAPDSRQMMTYSPFAERTSAQSLHEIIDWFLPISKNLEQPFCKAYARLELGFSKTTQTIVFLPSEVRQIEDTKPDGMPESEEFNDTSLKWSEQSDPELVMDDGCAAISLGAAQEIWRGLGRTDPLPSAFQARIGGAKGIWYISAPTDSISTDSISTIHRSKWIEVKKSQLKFQPHDDDLDDTKFNRHRRTFDLLKHSKPLATSTLNLAFIPILKDRGVPVDKIHDQILEYLDFERETLLQSINSPQSLRRWIHNRNAMLEDSDREHEITWLGGFPFSLLERIIIMLEGGFNPKHNKYLADATCRLMNKYWGRIVRKLSVPLSRSTNAIGIADPEGVLAPGEIHLAFSREFHDERSGELISYLHQKTALVARHPTLRRSDIQKVRAVFKHELAHIRDVVVFPRRGQIPLAHKLQGGDYDGDTFWICWEPMLTQDFKNAPIPSNVPSPQSFGIKVDRTPLGDVINKDDADSLREFLDRSFDFRCQPELLGRVTVLHEHLAYAMNTIDSANLNYLADIHDYLIDSAKNGYTYTSDGFRDFMKKQGIKQPGIPAYKAITKGKADSSLISRRQSPSEPPIEHDITDKLVFEVVMPHISNTMDQVKECLRHSQTEDPQLDSLYHQYRAWAAEDAKQGDHTLEAELDSLSEKLVRLKNLSNAQWSREKDKDTDDQYFERNERCHQEYKAIVLMSLDQLPVWLQRQLTMARGVHDPSNWELLKASALHATCHRNHNFVYQMAGKELIELKCANASSKSRRLMPEMWAIMKPRKAKKWEVAAEAADRQDEDDAGSEGIPESIVDDFD